MSGCQKLGLGDINSFKALLPSLELGFMERADFRDFFKVGFSSSCLVLVWFSLVWFIVISYSYWFLVFGNNYFSCSC